MGADLQALASTAQDFAPNPYQPVQMSYPQHQPQNGSNPYYPPSSTYSNYNVSYAVNSGGNGDSSLSTKQGLESIRNLVMDVKGGMLDARSYNQVGPRMSAIQSSQLPFLGGASMGDFQTGGSPGGVYGPVAQYALPIPDLRTKNDLVEADRMFELMQSTIYDNPQTVAAAGAGQPDAYYVQAMGRQSGSPSGLQLPSAHSASYTPNMIATSQQSNHSATPDLSPPSSAHSYKSENSPMQSTHGMAPATPGAMYPTLPGAASMTSAGYNPSSMAPTSTLGSQVDPQSRRRYSGGRLQKAAPARRITKEDAMDTSPDGAAASKSAISSSSSEAGPVSTPKGPLKNFSSSNIDPALGGASSPSGEIDEKAEEEWIGNARTVEALRKWLKHRLENHEYESDEVSSDEVKMEGPSLYPVLAGA